MSWRGLRYKGTERLTSREWNAVVDSLNDLYGFLTAGAQDIFVDEVYGRAGYFSEQVLVQGKPVIKDGDPISIYQFYEVAKSQITEAIDKSTLLSKTLSDLDQIYGKLPSKEDVASAIDSSTVAGYSLDIREYTRRTAETIEAYTPRLITIEQYTRETRDVLVKVKIDEYGNVGVKIAEPLLSALLNNIDVALSSRASEETLQKLVTALKGPVTVFISNGLDQAVNVQIVGCRDPACNDSVDIGSAITISAGSKDARTLTPETSGWLPFITVRVWCTVAPTSGVLDIWLVKSATDQVKIVDSLAVRDTDTHDTYTDPSNITIVSW